MSDPPHRRESGLSDIAQRALDAILHRGHEHDAPAPPAPASQAEQHTTDSGGVSIGEKAGSAPTSSSSGNVSGDTNAADSIAMGGLAAGAGAAASSASTSASDIVPTAPYGGSPPEEEEFVGSGGVGSASYMEALRKGHEEAGGEYTSDLRDPNRGNDDPTQA